MVIRIILILYFNTTGCMNLKIKIGSRHQLEHIVYIF